ncbi:MAG: NADH-quinone oxidoreductase subunit NuoN [Gammaproteobacteria bacterium]|nr:NADH-quinone oxidoreductase subunit NuoN [Gammaproteobacteria bacterium]
MNQFQSDILMVVPELFMLGMICLILVVDLFLEESRRDLTYWLSVLTLVGAFVLTATMFSFGEGNRLGFGGQFVMDDMAVLLKSSIYLIMIAVFVYSRPYLKDRELFRGEYYVLGLFGVLGMMIMVSAHNFLTIYLGLELLALSQYALVAISRDSGVASEAAVKYFVLGAIASGMLLYGMSILYGLSGSLDLAEISNYLATNTGKNLYMAFGLSFVVVGVGFKLGAVPFHMWVPDVYHGAPTSVTLYIGSAPKIAAFAMVIRLLVESMGSLFADWHQMLVVLAALSMAIGNVIAIAQSNIKRMLAYSTIAHVGFILMGILAGTPEGYSAAMFYAIVYAIMAAGGFGMILVLSRQGFEPENIEDFKGLNDRSPWFAFIMLLLMFSMAGVPPTVGFYAKFSVIQAAVRVDLVWLAVYAVVFSVVGAFYYLRVVKLMYFDKSDDDTVIAPVTDAGVVMSANGLLMLILGLFPGGLMALCANATNW